MSKLGRLSMIFLVSHGFLLAQDNWEKIRSIAESQHEIVKLLIKKKEFDKVFEASKKIFLLEFPREHEHLKVEEAKTLTDLLLPHQQFQLVHQILDQAIQVVNSQKLKAQLYKEKAYVCVKEGREEDAMKLFEKSIEMESTQP